MQPLSLRAREGALTQPLQAQPQGHAWVQAQPQPQVQAQLRVQAQAQPRIPLLREHPSLLARVQQLSSPRVPPQLLLWGQYLLLPDGATGIHEAETSAASAVLPQQLLTQLTRTRMRTLARRRSACWTRTRTQTRTCPPLRPQTLLPASRRCMHQDPRIFTLSTGSPAALTLRAWQRPHSTPPSSSSARGGH